MIYVPGLLTGQLSGKAGHNIASKNPYATTLTVQKHKSTAATPKSSAIRANTASLVALYKTLTSGEIADWKTLGAAMFVSGRLGRTYSLTAPGAFMSVNRNLATIGQAPVTTAPTLLRPPSVAPITLTAVGPSPGPQSLSLDLTTDPLDADTAVNVYGQVVRSASIFSPPVRSWKLITTLAPSSSGPWDILAEYIATCGDFVTGQTLWVKAIPVSLEGFQGAGSIQRAIVS